MSSHGMTPYIITRNASPNTTRISLCVPVSTISPPSVSDRKRASLSAFMSWTTDFDGSAFTRSA